MRQKQERLIIAPILACLQNVYQQPAVIEGQLLALLRRLTTWADYAQGYGPANLLALLRTQRGDLRGLDLSRLVLRGVYLQGVEMQDATLAGAMIRDSVFTATFDVIMGVAINGNGEYWAASSRNGQVRIRGSRA